MPIPAESTAVHGITDEMVRGKRFDDAAVASLLEGVAIVIAHNAGFDRPFVEPRFPRFASMAWGCTWQELPWDRIGIPSAKLEYLAYRYGFFYEGHRAEIDCLALLEVLRRPFGDQEQCNLKVLLDSAREPSCRVWATGSPFESKDLLKARAYRWEASRKTWFKDLSRDDLDAELAWLKAEVFSSRSVSLEVEEFSARDRYSDREGRKEILRA
jgi:DNA polymerase-3 subunit epsilon